MRYELWDKQSPVNGNEAISIIGEEQMLNEDNFILVYDNEVVIAIESIDTLRVAYELVGETWESIADQYLAMIAPSLDVLKANKIESLHKSCEQAIYDGFEFDGNIFEYDLKDQSRFQSTMIAIQMGMTGTVSWASKTNGIVDFTEVTFPLLFQAGLMHLQTMIGKSRILEGQVGTATTIEEINAIAWE